VSLCSRARAQVLQLYEMLAVRHGIMVVGLPLAGKSAVLATLAAALSALAAAGEPGPLFERVDAVAINPKAVTMEELYGAGDRATQEWRVRTRRPDAAAWDVCACSPTVAELRSRMCLSV
jgi:Mrp family chromosome partitioning ATPase